MDSTLREALPFLAVPIVSIAVAGLVPLFYIPDLKARSYIQHLAAGTVFAAVAAELLAGMQELAPVGAGFAFGTVRMLAVKWFTRARGPHEYPGERRTHGYDPSDLPDPPPPGPPATGFV